MSKKSDRKPKFFLQSLSSLKITVTLLAFLGMVCALGTVIPLRSDYVSFRHFLIGGVGRFLISTGLDEPFSSSLFLAILGIFAVHLLICTFVRLPRLTKTVFNPKIKQDKGFFDSAVLSATGKTSLNSEEVLTKKGYTVFTDDSQGQALLGVKGGFAPFGPHVTHIGILLIFLGGLIGQYYGYEGFGQAARGDSFDVYSGEYYRLTRKMQKNIYLASFYRDLEKEKILFEEDYASYNTLLEDMDSIEKSLKNIAQKPVFTVKVLDATEAKYENSSDVKDWTSRLQILKNGKPVLEQVIEVNVPLSFEGVNIFQHSFSHNFTDVPYKEVVLKKGQVFSDGDGNPIEIEIIDFYRDFSIRTGADGKPEAFSKSETFGNVALKVRLGRDKGTDNHVYLFTGPPHSIHDNPDRKWFIKFREVRNTDTADSDGELSFVCEIFKRESLPVTGVSISSDPGTVFVWLGCFFMMCGMGLSFYIEKKQIWIDVTDDGTVSVAGKSSRFPALFSSEFTEMCKALEISHEEERGGKN